MAWATATKTCMGKALVANSTSRRWSHVVRVVREADAIRYGAMAQGRNVSVAEALEMAHSLVSTPHRDQAARRKITNGLQQRQAQVTVRPTNKTGKNEQVSDDPIERAERNLAKRLKKLS